MSWCHWQPLLALANWRQAIESNRFRRRREVWKGQGNPSCPFCVRLATTLVLRPQIVFAELRMSGGGIHEPATCHSSAPPAVFSVKHFEWHGKAFAQFLHANKFRRSLLRRAQFYLKAYKRAKFCSALYMEQLPPFQANSRGTRLQPSFTEKIQNRWHLANDTCPLLLLM